MSDFSRKVGVGLFDLLALTVQGQILFGGIWPIAWQGATSKKKALDGIGGVEVGQKSIGPTFQEKSDDYISRSLIWDPKKIENVDISLYNN